MERGTEKKIRGRNDVRQGRGEMRKRQQRWLDEDRKKKSEEGKTDTWQPSVPPCMEEEGCKRAFLVHVTTT